MHGCLIVLVLGLEQGCPDCNSSNVLMTTSTDMTSMVRMTVVHPILAVDMDEDDWQ